MKLNPYPEYKDSGVSWLGKVPTHWEVLPNRAIFEEKNVKNSNIENLLSVTIKRGVIQQSELLENSSKKDSSNEDKSNYKLVLPGYITYNKMRMWQGAVGVSKYKGIVSPAYIVIKPRKNANPWYYHYLMRTPSCTRESFRNSYGICDDQLSLRFKDFKVIMSPLPPLEEQKAIVAFFRNIDKQINIFIRGKRKLIELFKEQKQAIINHAIARGLDPGVRLKPSGVQWLGDIPEHWEVVPLRWYISISSVDFIEGDKISRKKSCDSTYPVIGGNGLMGFTNVKNCNSSTIVIGRVGALCGNVHLIKEPSWITDNALRINSLKKFDHELLAFQLQCINLNRLANANAQPLITGGVVKSQRVCLFSIHEQKRIVEYIKKKSDEIDTAILRAEREIELIREYRTRLIADVVTGKVDVRDIPVAETPEIEEPGGIDSTLETAEPAEPADLTETQENPDEDHDD